MGLRVSKVLGHQVPSLPRPVLSPSEVLPLPALDGPWGHAAAPPGACLVTLADLFLPQRPGEAQRPSHWDM